MENKYMIFTDVSISIDPVYAEENDVHIIPMDCIIDSNIRKCYFTEKEESLINYYNDLRNGVNVKTSQVTPREYVDIFEPFIKEGKDILYIALSSGLSGTYQSSILAANELKEKYKDAKVVPIDSLSATAGVGLLVESAVENLKKGMSIEENEEWINENRHKLCHWFMVEDLEFLRRGGRISPTTSIVGRTLNIKPILRLNEEGKIIGIHKKRGIKSAVKQLASLYEMSSSMEDKERVYIIHSDAIENANLLEKAILEKNKNCRITKRILSPTIGAHTGPGMIGVFHYSK